MDIFSNGLGHMLRSKLVIPAVLLACLAGTAAQAQVAEPAAAASSVPPEGAVGGMGDINLYPKRIVIDRRQRIASIGMYNRTPDIGEYEISIIDMMMAPDGGVYQIDKLPEGVTAERLNAASAMLRWSPRRVMLQGNESQTIRIMARPPADLPDGEYRAHFMAVSVPRDADQGYSIDDAVGGAANADGDIGVTIRPRFGISIPVIVRIGDTTLDVSLHDVRFVQTQGGPGIALTIHRSGTRSAFGDVVVTAPGVDGPVAVARGVGVYPEIDSRLVVLGLHSQFDRNLLQSGMVLSVAYIDDDVTPGDVLARQELVVP